MTSSLGNGAHARAPGFEAARITPEQAEALAAGFLPSWETDGGALAGATNGHAAGELRSTMKSNGVHAESHAPPSRTRVSEPEDSVVIDRSITAAQVAAPPPDSGRVRVATARLAAPPVAAPAPPIAPPPSFRPPAPAPVAMRPMPQHPARPATRALAVDDDIPAQKSKKGLFIGLGVGAAALLAIIIGFAASGGDASKADDSGGPSITVVKPDNSAKAESTPATPLPTQTTTATSQPTSPEAVAATPPPTPVTALPVATMQARAKPARQAAAQPAYNPPPPRATPPRSGGGAIVKDVPF
jgi:hypothetical protein